MKSLKKKSKCRLTGRPIELFAIGTDDIPTAWRTVTGWLYADVSPEEALRIRVEDRVYPDPVDFCWRSTYEGDPCTAKIRPENIRAQLWACGRHMAKFQEEEERKKRRELEGKQRAQRESLFEWELSEAIRVYEKLLELGWGAILPDSPPRKSWGTSIRNDEITINQAEFLALVEQPIEEEEEYEDDEDDEDDEDFTAVEEDFFASDV